MEKYVDGFVIPIQKDKVDEYREIAQKASEVWKDYGALEYFECVGDDLDAKDTVPFTAAAGAKDGETVIFSWIVYESREHRDRVNKEIMTDPRLADMMDMETGPFDPKRMVYGGFRVLVEL